MSAMSEYLRAMVTRNTDQATRPRIYVCGPMSNLPANNLPAFAEATQQLEERGYAPVNPGRHGVTPGYTWADYLRRGLTEMLGCDGVATLPGWSASRGASLEVRVATELGIPVRMVDEWLASAVGEVGA